MRRSVLTLTILPALLLSSVLVAQDLDKVSRPAGQSQTIDQLAQTEDMWFYLQELRRYDDPQVVIRRKAEKKASNAASVWPP